MTTGAKFSTFAATLLFLTSADAAAATAAELKAQLRQAERAFARSMADRDHAAFRAQLADDTVFFNGHEAVRGKAAVAADWKPYFEGPRAPFSWEPVDVELLADGSLGFTSGPVRDPAGKVIGTFNSVWRRARDGAWKIVFDKGCPPCDCGGPAALPAPTETPH